MRTRFSKQSAGLANLQAGIDFEAAVGEFYQVLYRFAYSLTGCESRSADLTQETYHRLLTKGATIRNPQRVKSWLFTTLYRLFLGHRRHLLRFPQVSLEGAAPELPPTQPGHADSLDANAVVAALQELNPKYRAPLALFYLQELSYKEVALALGIPIGTVMSRLSRGKALLRKQLEGGGRSKVQRAVPEESLPPTFGALRFA